MHSVSLNTYAHLSVRSESVEPARAKGKSLKGGKRIQKTESDDANTASSGDEEPAPSRKRTTKAKSRPETVKEEDEEEEQEEEAIQEDLEASDDSE